MTRAGAGPLWEAPAQSREDLISVRNGCANLDRGRRNGSLGGLSRGWGSEVLSFVGRLVLGNGAVMLAGCSVARSVMRWR